MDGPSVQGSSVTADPGPDPNSDGERKAGGSAGDSVSALDQPFSTVARHRGQAVRNACDRKHAEAGETSRSAQGKVRGWNKG